MNKTNVDFWLKILQNPSPLYMQLFKEEALYISKNIPKDSYLLDIGCGDGRVIKLITPTTQNIVGIDNDETAIKNAGEQLKAFPNIWLIKSDALNMPFEQNTFDVATFMMTLVNFGDFKIKVLKEIHRVLKENGILVLSVYSEDSYETRFNMYTEIGLPIKMVEDKRKFIFDAIGSAESSEQFSIDQLNEFAQESGFKIVDMKKVDGIAYLCTLKNNFTNAREAYK